MIDVNKIRRASSEAYFPYGAATTAYILVRPDGSIFCKQKERDSLRQMVRAATTSESVLLAVWPGTHWSDVFLVDDIEKMIDSVSWLKGRV